ncbi:MAG: sigma-70 family RNA polymerase sigma factor [Myxococcota bacterium]
MEGTRNRPPKCDAASEPAPSLSPDERLVADALAGDPARQRDLSSRLLDSVQREVAFSLSRRGAIGGRDLRQELRDLVQEILVGLFSDDGRELRRWDPTRGRSLDSFVRLVARRRVARALQRPARDPVVAAVDAIGDHDAGDDSALLRRLEDRQVLDSVLQALFARMTERDHELFELLYVDQSEPEIVATQMGMSRGAVNAWSYRMRKLARAVSLEQESSAKGRGGR